MDSRGSLYNTGLRRSRLTRRARLLLAAAEQTEVPVYVVLTMRSDFLGDCAQFPALPEAFNRNQYLVPRMTRAQRRQSIEGPLEIAGVLTVCSSGKREVALVLCVIGFEFCGDVRLGYERGDPGSSGWSRCRSHSAGEQAQQPPDCGPVSGGVI